MYGNESSNGNPLKFNSVEFRDGIQALLAARVVTDDMLPFLTLMDSVGYDSMEMWGGATFDVCIRYLRDDPWERIRKFKRFIRKTPLKMSLRGQNLVGYKAYPDDIVERFVFAAAEAGIEIFQIFDALQDIRNCETAFKAALTAGCRVEGSIQYNISPYFKISDAVEEARRQVELGASSIHIEDMAGLMTPAVAGEMVGAMKQKLEVPIHLHCHSSGGMAEMCYWEAIRAGVDGVDVCVSSMGMGAGHPPIESFIVALQGTARDTGVDLETIEKLNRGFAALRKKYAQYETKLSGVDVGCLRHQIPGGMLGTLQNQLAMMQISERLPEILKEVIQVRADMGYPPLATPSSQICGQQATNNVITGKRYGSISKEMKNYCLGMYGKPPGPIAPELMKKAVGEEKPITCRPASLLASGYETAREESAAWARTEEDILTYALFPTVAPEYLKEKYASL